jgi:hypothetical protein
MEYTPLIFIINKAFKYYEKYKEKKEMRIPNPSCQTTNINIHITLELK